ncbi:MAG: HAMP domain-containing histidine kinase [Candidatus Eremiobacteraeota bacterium]|nr:HAMP domain-containing histidine kinase [Candidatus Eremiobacteraeota bacterium]
MSLSQAALFVLISAWLFDLTYGRIEPGQWPRMVGKQVRRLEHGARPEELCWPPECSVVLFQEQGPVVLQGSWVAPEPRGLELALGGQPSHCVLPDRVEAWNPLRDSQGRTVGAVLAVLQNPGRGIAGLPPGHAARRRASAMALLVCLLLSVPISRLLTAPVLRLVRAVERLDLGNLEERLPETGPRELQALAHGFNQMASRLKESAESLHSEKVRAERLEASRREFLADVSHNLGTPLAAIQGWASSVADGLVKDPDEARRQVQRIQREVSFVSRMVRQLLDLCRWESGAPELHLQRFRAVEPLMEAAESLEGPAELQGVSLRLDGINPRLMVCADRSRTRELFQIFLENCVKHAGPNATIVVSMRPDGDRVRIRVEDDGVGIPSGSLERVKERYSTSSGRGSGLGLAIAERLIQGHGGRLDLSSPPGGGTIIEFSLPIAREVDS